MTENNLDLTYMAKSMTVVPCPVCGADEHRLVSEGPARGGVDLSYVMCVKCTHIYMKHRPSMEAYSRFYESGDYRTMTSPNKKSNRTPSKQNGLLKEKRYSHGVRFYEEHLKDFLTADDLVFDLGAGDGAWLYGLHKASGCQVQGLEPSAADVAAIKDIMGVDIYCGLIEDLKDDIIEKYSNKVKVVIVSGSLQHMLDPMACLDVAYKILKPGGMLYICNKDVFEHYLSLKSPYPRPFAELRTIDHPHYFHPKGYIQMVERAGFEVSRFVSHSKVRFETMEILGTKTEEQQVVRQPIAYQSVIDRINEMDRKVNVFRLLPVRAIRAIGRRAKTLLHYKKTA